METFLFPLKVGGFTMYFLGRFSGWDTCGVFAILLAGLVACLLIFFFRSFHRPMGAAYWLVCLLPSLTGTLWGLCRYDLAVYWWAELSRNERYLSLNQSREGSLFSLKGIFCIHYGLVLSCLLCLTILYFYTRDLGLAYFRRLKKCKGRS